MLYSNPQFDWGMDQILLGPEVSLGRLHRCMAQQQLDLLQFSTRGPAQLRGSATTVVRRDPRHSGGCRVGPEQLPGHLFGQEVVLHLTTAVDRSEHVAIFYGSGTGPVWSGTGPGIDCNLDPGRHRNRAHAAVLSNEVHDAPASIVLLYVRHGKRRDLGSSQTATEQHGDDGTVAQPLRRWVRRVQERLRLLQRQPIPQAVSLWKPHPSRA